MQKDDALIHLHDDYMNAFTEAMNAKRAVIDAENTHLRAVERAAKAREKFDAAMQEKLKNAP